MKTAQGDILITIAITLLFASIASAGKLKNGLTNVMINSFDDSVKVYRGHVLGNALFTTSVLLVAHWTEILRYVGLPQPVVTATTLDDKNKTQSFNPSNLILWEITDINNLELIYWLELIETLVIQRRNNFMVYVIADVQQ